MNNAADETVLWRGSPTTWLGIGWYLLMLLLIVGLGGLHYYLRAWPMSWTLAAMAVLLIPMIVVWAGLKTVSYELTQERLRCYRGILVRHVDELELYRVKDTAVMEPIWLRLVGCGHVTLMSSDLSSPQVQLRAVRSPRQVRELIRQRVEQVRQAKGVRALDVD